eukprot:UN06386
MTYKFLFCAFERRQSTLKQLRHILIKNHHATNILLRSLYYDLL